jgi:hypothetical protein
MRTVLFLNFALSVVTIGLLVLFQLGQIPAASAWQTLVIACLGAGGALLRATIRFRQRVVEPDDLRLEPAFLVFRAAFGAILAIIVTFFLQLRVIDFPYLHTGASDSTPSAPAALYVFGFASGFVEQIFFSALERLASKHVDERGQEHSEQSARTSATNR